MLSKNNFLKKYFAAITAFIVLIIFLITLAPSVMEIDSGELAAVQATLGIAHPTGYPLFSILGYLLLKIPLPLTTIYRANLLASVFCAAGVWLFIKSVYLILVQIISANGAQVKPKKKKDSNNSKAEAAVGDKSFVIISSICAGLMLAFNKTIWTQSTSVEVYSLQILLINLIIYTTLKAYYSQKQKLTGWMWFGFTLALGFSNHMTTLLLLPFTGMLFFMKEKLNTVSLKKIFYSLAAFVPAIVLIYSFLPLRALSNPILNWGNPVNFENFFRHVSGRQYQVWLFSSANAAKEHLGQFLESFPAEFGYIGLLVGIIGIFYSYKTARKIFYPLAVTFLFSVLYTINYDIHDLDSYFSTAYITFSFFIAFGSLQLAVWFNRKLTPHGLVPIVLMAFAFIPFLLNYSDVDESNVYTYEDYTKAILNSTEKDAVVFSYQWDYFVSASYYFQYVENYRKDISVIDKELLRRSWYYNQLRRNHPDVMAGLTPEVSDFLEAVKPFEKDEDFDSGTIEKSYRAFMTNLVAKSIDKRNVYIGPELVQNEMQRGEFALPQGYQLVPDVLLFKVVKGNEYVPANDPNFAIRFPKRKDHYINFIENMIASMLTYRAMYEIQFDKIDRARVYINKVKKDFPEFQIPIEVANRIK